MFWSLMSDVKEKNPALKSGEELGPAWALLWDGYWIWIILAIISCLALWPLRKFSKELASVQTKQLLYALVEAARSIADGEHGTERDKKGELKALCTHLVAAMVSSYPDVEDVRAITYFFNEDHTELQRYVHAGTRDPSGPFTMNDARGKAAINFAHTSTTARLQDDTQKKDTEEGWKGSGQGYRCFIAAPILSSGGRYGMLTVDAKAPYALTAEDELVVMLAAQLIGLAKASIVGRIKVSDPGVKVKELSGGESDEDNGETEVSETEVSEAEVGAP